MKQETKIKSLGMLFVIASGMYFGSYAKWDYQDCHKQTDLFVNGQILEPDYTHNDSLVVINAKLLNDELQYCEGSDGSYNDLLGEGCVNYADYQDYINVVKK